MISFIIVANFTSLLYMLENYYLLLTTTKFMTSMFCTSARLILGFPGDSMVKNLPASARDS